MRLSTFARGFSQKVQRSTSPPGRPLVIRTALLVRVRAERTSLPSLLLRLDRTRLRRLDHLVDEAVRLRVGAGHEVVAVGVGLDARGRLAGVAHEDVDERL